MDVGCGEGVLLGFISEKCGSRLKLCGIDLSSNANEKAKKALPEDIDLSVGDAEHLPYEGGEFDVLICTHSFHHYPNPLEALKEFNQCLTISICYRQENEEDNAKIVLALRSNYHG